MRLCMIKPLYFHKCSLLVRPQYSGQIVGFSNTDPGECKYNLKFMTHWRFSLFHWSFSATLHVWALDRECTPHKSHWLPSVAPAVGLVKRGKRVWTNNRCASNKNIIVRLSHFNFFNWSFLIFRRLFHRTKLILITNGSNFWNKIIWSTPHSTLPLPTPQFE